MFHFLTIILRTATIYFTTNFLFCHMAIFIFIVYFTRIFLQMLGTIKRNLFTDTAIYQ